MNQPPRKIDHLIAFELARKNYERLKCAAIYAFAYCVALPLTTIVRALMPRHCMACGSRHDPPWGMRVSQVCPSCGQNIYLRGGRRPDSVQVARVNGLMVDEKSLSDFFGVPPRKQRSDDRELHGWSVFEVPSGDQRLFIQISSVRGQVDLCVTSAISGAAALELHLHGIAELQFDDNRKRLSFMQRVAGKSEMVAGASITLAPISVTVGSNH